MFIPFKSSFDNAKKLERYSNFCLYIFSFILILIFFIKEKNINNFLYIISSSFVIFHYFLLIIKKIMLFNTEIKRRIDFIDNSFNTLLWEERSNKYFSNDNLSGWIYKAFVNSFESLYFTLKISKKMLKWILFKSLLILTLAILFLIINWDSVEKIVYIIHLSLPIVLLFEIIKHFFFIFILLKLYENYRNIFSNLNCWVLLKQKIPEMINMIIWYESLIIRWGILLDTEIYNKENSKLSKNWERIKKEYNITN